MSTRQKVMMILVGLFLSYCIAMIIIITVNFREFGIKGAQKRAMLTAEIVRSGLTAHMVNVNCPHLSRPIPHFS